MKLTKNVRLGINLVIIGISAIVWILLLINPDGIMTIEHCHVSAAGPSATSLNMLLAMNPISSQLIGWGLMVVAMMLPKLIFPVQTIYMQSIKRLRFILAFIFVLSYLAVWMVTGVFMVAIIMALNLFMPMSFIPAIAVFLIALIWQFSPIKQRFLNLGHQHQILAAFGWTAFKDASVYGCFHGLWCVGAGWALMLFPMLLPQGHNLAMVIVTFIMISEHMEHPRYPKWEVKYRTKLLRIIVAQVKIRLIPILTNRI